MEPELTAIIDGLAADALTARVIMLEMALRSRDAALDGEGWTDAFIANLHERLDAAEQLVGQEDAFGWHEGARQRIDQMGLLLRRIPRGSSTGRR